MVCSYIETAMHWNTPPFYDTGKCMVASPNRPRYHTRQQCFIDKLYHWNPKIGWLQPNRLKFWMQLCNQEYLSACMTTEAIEDQWFNGNVTALTNQFGRASIGKIQSFPSRLALLSDLDVSSASLKVLKYHIDVSSETQQKCLQRSVFGPSLEPNLTFPRHDVPTALRFHNAARCHDLWHNEKEVGEGTKIPEHYP